ncbi:MAG: hypothetical protein KIT31_09225 [Deltaproteobacteria bacterium]|nr:hypothetical protein [Deltaproteobacteria bacterium]
MWAVLRSAALQCEAKGLLTLPANASYASLASCLRTLAAAEWHGDRPLFLFFDQFENVFRQHALAVEFRDLALAIREVAKPLVLGFAWKTDFVGWTEEFPYHLRDDIRGSATVLNLTPFGPRDIGTLVGRLERSAQQKISPDLQERLREYSGGLPWLFKKLASHMIQQLSLGISQERLASEALNAQALFESDLAELSAAERGALQAIARQAPVPFDEIRETVSPPVVQSLLNRRLIVQVGERIDTYWDVFRDFLNTGRVPIEDTYILRQTPQAVSRLLRAALDSGGQMRASQAASLLETSEPGVFNLSRDLRLLGVLSYAPGEIRLADEIRAATDVEETLRAMALRTLRRHRVFRLIEELWMSNDGHIGVAEFADAIRTAFPAVAAGAKTWRNYARAFATWFEYVGLSSIDRGGMIGSVSATPKDIAILTTVRRLRPDASFPGGAPGPALALLRRLRDPSAPGPSTESALTRALRDLEFLGAITAGRDGNVQLADEDLVDSSGVVSARRLRDLIERVPGAAAALRVLEQEPATTPQVVGKVLADQYGAQWSPTTMSQTGKHFRGWARHAGIATKQRRGPSGNVTERDEQEPPC